MIKAIDIFSGCGGVSCGLTRAGFKVKAAVDNEKKAVNVYLSYQPLSRVNVLMEDVHKVSAQKLLKISGLRKDDLYLFAGCPPCQNFSRQNTKNKEKSENQRKELLFEFLRLIEEVNPPFILMENVQGITSVFNQPILDEFEGRLEDKSKPLDKRYKIFAKVLNAANYGVPQVRMRFVLHAVRYDIYEELQEANIPFDLPAATHSKDEQDGLLPWITVSQAIGDLPAMNAGEHYIGEGIFNHKCAGLSPMNLERIQYIRAHGGSRTGLPERLVLECHKKKDREGNVFTGRKDVYGIMDPDKPSPTITGGCLCYSKGRYGHFEQDRAISIREAARIQTFPDDFKFTDNLSDAALQIGNAVPVKLVEASGKVIINAIRALLKARRSK